MMLFSCFFEAFFIKLGIEGVEVALVELIGKQPKILTEALIVDNLALAQESDDVFYIRIVGQPQDVVVSRARLLLP